MQSIDVVSRTQRIVVGPNKNLNITGTARSVSVVPAGPPGPPGPRGEDGAPGPRGEGGGKRWYGEGEPGVIIGAEPNDEYLDMLTGNLYILQ